MLTIRKAWWATALLAAFVGCAGDEPATTETPATSPAAEKPADKAETPKAETPKEEPPKVEGPAAAPSPAPAGEEKKEGAEEKKADAAESKALSADEVAELEKLPAEDKVVALKQVVCPVSGEHLGSMGAPIKVSAEGKSFMICCGSCEKEVKSDPKAVVAKLNQK
ncbi:hypothetical protein [Singulisphaera sp. PoT]|uniref:hypothetical protein n=1 Tax=Singulisphaera sp. PoT TaxID=3411797 RepID=UPI003BF50715